MRALQNKNEISDIESLTTKQIQEGYIHFRQQKTGDMERIKLNSNAINIYKDQIKISSDENTLFNLPGRSYMNRLMREWIKESDIDKRITFHCARHTFATMSLTFDIDIFTDI